MNRQIWPWILFYLSWLFLGAYFFHVYNHAGDAQNHQVQTVFAPSSYSLDEGSTYLDQKVEMFNNKLREGTPKDVMVIGKYSNDEENYSIFPNLGIARAISAKNYLSQFAIDGKVVDLGSSLVSDIVDEGDIEVSLLRKGRRSWVPDEETVRKPINIYIDYDAQTLKLNVEQRRALYDVARYLDINKKALLIVAGHTDSRMDEMESLGLSNNNALFASNILKANGIPEERMSIVAAGFSKPIADNKTEEGRAANRRISVQIKG